MTASHDAVANPSILLALVCLAVVHRLRPGWTSITLEEAARGEGVSPERLSRLCSRAVAPFQRALQTLTRIGRPSRRKEEDTTASENALLRAMLGVATSILKHVSLRRPAIRALITAAFLRLKQQHPELTRTSFCDALGLSQRTFRHWMAGAGKTEPAASPTKPPTAKKRPPKRPPRRPRFGFDVTLPDTQLAADTTDLQAFGVPLKLVAAQDLGGRDRDLLDAIIVDHRESADLVIAALTEALGDKEGQQVITDQGTPYMATATQAAIEALGAEHAPQREGDPLGKATIERAFGTVKRFAGPLLALTDRLAAAFPALRAPDLAKASVILLLTALLKAYQAGARAAARADEQRAGVSADELLDLAEQSREKSRAEASSARLLLTAIHRDYNITQPLDAFIRSMRRFPLPVLKDAERAFSSQVHRDDIRDRAAYFAAIVRRCNEPYQRRLAAIRRQKEQEERQREHDQKLEATYAAWHADPAAWLYDALDTLATQWFPERKELLFRGTGLGKKWLCDAVGRLNDLHAPTAAADIARGILAQFQNNNPRNLSRDGLNAIANILEKHLPENPTPQTDCKQDFASAILRNNGPPRRPLPLNPC